eukprot:COSAG05_NODE_2283_length_3287_cov_5.276035_2_plen_92_part_00
MAKVYNDGADATTDRYRTRSYSCRCTSRSISSEAQSHEAGSAGGRGNSRGVLQRQRLHGVRAAALLQPDEHIGGADRSGCGRDLAAGNGIR